MFSYERGCYQYVRPSFCALTLETDLLILYIHVEPAALRFLGRPWGFG